MTGDAQQLRAEIKATREELGDTVQALAEKTDVGAQARRKLDETKATVAEKREEVVGRFRGATPDSAASAAAHATQAARRNPARVVLVVGLLAGFALGRLTAR